MRKLGLVLIGLLCSLWCYGQNDFVVFSNKEIVKDLIKIKIIPKSSMISDLSDSELREVENIMKECITKYNEENESKISKIRKLESYKIQYVPFTNKKGEKEVWINGFCTDVGKDWKNEVVLVMDGGNCFFSIRIKLSERKCDEIRINGIA